MDCRKFVICSITIGGGGRTSVSNRAVRGKLSANADGKLTVAFLAKPPDEGPTLFLDQDITVPPALAKKLGFKSATVLKGEYAFNSRRAVLNARLTK